MSTLFEFVSFLFETTCSLDMASASSINVNYSTSGITADVEIHGLELFMDVKKHLREGGLENVKGTKFEGLAIAIMYADLLEYE